MHTKKTTVTLPPYTPQHIASTIIADVSSFQCLANSRGLVAPAVVHSSRGYGWRCSDILPIIASHLPYEDHGAAREALGDNAAWVIPRRYASSLYTCPRNRVNELSILYTSSDVRGTWKIWRAAAKKREVMHSRLVNIALSHMYRAIMPNSWLSRAIINRSDIIPHIDDKATCIITTTTVGNAFKAFLCTNMTAIAAHNPMNLFILSMAFRYDRVAEWYSGAALIAGHDAVISFLADNTDRWLGFAAKVDARIIADVKEMAMRRGIRSRR